MFFYQAPSSYYRQPARMYLQYQQPYRAQALRRSAYVPRSAVSAYVAGNQVAASGSLLQGLIERLIAKKLSPLKNVFAKRTNVHFVSPPPASVDEEPLADEPETLADEIPVAVQNDEDGAVSIAEAYPAEEETFADEPVQNDEPVQADAPQDDAPVAPVAPVADEVPLADPLPAAAAPLAPVLPKRKNKVTVELDTQDDEDQYVAPKKGRPAYGGAAASNPINTFFPINFGNTQGGAIAVANAYSTGQKGGARSHAIAYGSPASAAKRQRPQKAAAAAPAQ